MEPELITYQKFNDIALADGLADLLQRHNINYVIVEDSLTGIPAFVDNELSKRYEVKIKGEDFELVDKIVAEEVSVNITEVEPDYYLFNFSDEELMEIIVKADEWSAFDNQLARKILADRGKPVSDAAILDIKEKRIEELKEPDPPQTTWIIVGYITAILGGVLGVFIGWHLSSHKKTLPNGEKVYGYTAHDRRQGKIILYLSIVCFCIVLILRGYAGLF